MATYAIGDIQGCFDSLRLLLKKIEFDKTKDCLWLLGDLINRGPKSLEVLCFVKKLGASAISVLGNHDLHFLAIFYGDHPVRPKDTFAKLLESRDVEDYAHWLRQQKLFHVDKTLDFAMSHAGVPAMWNLTQVQGYANELEQTIAGEGHQQFFQHMYGDQPNCWQESLTGMERWRCLTSYFTRMRWIAASGALQFASKGPVSEQPSGYVPWFDQVRKKPFGTTLLFGHWAALAGHTHQAEAIALDTGCVWGERLTALCLETRELTSVSAIDINSSN